MAIEETEIAGFILFTFDATSQTCARNGSVIDDPMCDYVFWYHRPMERLIGNPRWHSDDMDLHMELINTYGNYLSYGRKLVQSVKGIPRFEVEVVAVDHYLIIGHRLFINSSYDAQDVEDHLKITFI